MDHLEKLEALLTKKNSQEEAFLFFNELEAADMDMMRGLWKGEELRTGHPFEGLLTAAGWYGKKFVDTENVHPLIFEDKKGRLYSGNPGLLPLHLPFQRLPAAMISASMKFGRPLFSTKKSRARLRTIHFHGKTSAGMIYDQKAIIDVFRKVNDRTLLGVMDIKGVAPGTSYFFVLRKTEENIEAK